MPEIGKVMIINTAVGLVEDDRNAIELGINVFDNSELYDALVLGLIRHQPNEQPISYADLAALLNLTQRIVGSAVNRLIDQGMISKEDRGRVGAVYKVHLDIHSKLPIWIAEFTAALLELHNNAELKARVVEDCKTIEIKRGMEILREELKNKFYKRN